jgi:hypothetical protein
LFADYLDGSLAAGGGGGCCRGRRRLLLGEEETAAAGGGGCCCGGRRLLLLGEEAAAAWGRRLLPGNVAVCPCCRWKEHCKDGRCLPAAGMAVVGTARGQPLLAAV